MTDQLEKLDYYTLLGIGFDADPSEVRSAFRRFARRYHPDRFAGRDPDKMERATVIYRRGSEAVQTLTDPLARAAYDKGLRAGRLRLRAEELDRAVAEVGRSEAPARPKPPAVRSPQARRFHARAAELWRAGDLRGAWQALQSALSLEPENALLRSHLHKVERALRSPR